MTRVSLSVAAQAAREPRELCMSTRPLRGHPEAAHFCGKQECGTNVPGNTNPFCAERGTAMPFGADDETPALACMRIAGHDGQHSAYAFSVSVPEVWS